jgi:hypothetical protein
MTLVARELTRCVLSCVPAAFQKEIISVRPLAACAGPRQDPCSLIAIEQRISCAGIHGPERDLILLSTTVRAHSIFTPRGKRTGESSYGAT